jgi:hypothetical protein
MNKYATWFCRAMWAGIIADWVLCIPTIFAPNAVLSLLGMRLTQDPVWTAFSTLLVLLLSLFYIPAASDPYRYRWSAWISVLARPPGVLFFLFFQSGFYPAFGIMDGVLFLIQFPLLLLTYQHGPNEDWQPVNTAPQGPPDDPSSLWLKRTLWAGIIADWVLGLPAIFWPEKVLSVLGMRPTADPIWTSFAAMILILLSIAYIPGANEPYRYRACAWLAVLARPPGVIFFLLLYAGTYPAFGIMDLVLFLVQFPFLIKTMQLRPELGPEQDRETREYRGTTYQYVKDAAWNNPYTELPKHKGLRPGKFIQFLNDSARNMHDRRDIRPKYDKLIHAHGICFAGIWRIDADSPYTGYFKKGSKGLVIARGSVAGIFTKRGFPRAFGFGGKIFPTLSPNDWVWPANFVTVSHLSGSKAPHITDIEVSNGPTIGLDPIANAINRFVFRIMDTRPGYRQLFPISTLGLKPEEKPVTPDLMMLRVDESMPKIDAEDFRDELRLKHYPNNKLIYTINVKNFEDTRWERLGVLEFTEDMISEGSDKHLHFWIPRDIPTQRA